MKLSPMVMALSLTAIASAPSLAAPLRMTDAQLDRVVAGTDYTCPPHEQVKGNNGWGNGAEGTNAGSFSGATAASKSSEMSMPAFGKINTNPTTSNGR